MTPLLSCTLAARETASDIVVTGRGQRRDHLQLVLLGAGKDGPRGAWRAIQDG